MIVTEANLIFVLFCLWIKDLKGDSTTGHMVPVKKCVFLNMQKLPVFFQSSSMNRISSLILVGLSLSSDDESTCCRPCLFSYQCKQQAGAVALCLSWRLPRLLASCMMHLASECTTAHCITMHCTTTNSRQLTVKTTYVATLRCCCTRALPSFISRNTLFILVNLHAHVLGEQRLGAILQYRLSTLYRQSWP